MAQKGFNTWSCKQLKAGRVRASTFFGVYGKWWNAAPGFVSQVLHILVEEFHERTWTKGNSYPLRCASTVSDASLVANDCPTGTMSKVTHRGKATIPWVKTRAAVSFFESTSKTMTVGKDRHFFEYNFTHA